MPLTIAYLAQGKVRLKVGSEPVRTLESPYATTIRERAIRAQQRNSWKSQGSGFLAGSMLWGQRGANQEVATVYVTSVGRGADPGQLVYSLESGSLCALLAAGNLGGDERRLWNNNKFRLQHVRACPGSGDLVFSVIHSNGTANIGVMPKEEGGVREVTEGDSVDTAPQWSPDGTRRIIFQSAGVGRNREGQFLALGPFSIQELDLDSSELVTLIEQPDVDFLAPRRAADGTVYYIRRPYARTQRVGFLRVVKDIVLFPFRFGFALFQYLNFFSMRYSGKKLVSSGDARAREMDVRQMLIWGNLVNAQQAHADPEDDLVPGSWQLARRSLGGDESVVAKGVLAYDIGVDGSIAYSNGNSIFVLKPDGRKERVVSERMIEQVVLLES